MSIFDWFSRKPSDKPAPDSSGLGHVDPTVPLASPRGQSKVAGGNTVGGAPANRKTERLERRELLYRVVRDAMTKAGVLSSSYKFKVLSLDQHGRQYLIMMDVANEFAGATNRLAEIESLIAQSAKTRHEILVTAVYWRVNETVTAGLSRSTAVPLTPATRVAVSEPATPAATAPAAAAPAGQRYEPLHPEEMMAFKQALASGNPPHTPVATPGQQMSSGRRNPLPPDFEDTELSPDVGDEKQHQSLSGTQYGDLH
jgi:hypothetical protein